MIKIKPDKNLKWKGLAIAIFWILLWQLGAMAVAMPLILPSPLAAIKSLGALLVTKAFYYNVLATFYRCILGIALSFIVGVFTSILSYRYALFRQVITLPVNFLKSTPVMAVIIYALLLLQSGNVPIFVCFLMCFPVVHVNLLSGLDSISREHLEMAHIFDLSPRTQFRWIYLPSIEPEIKASLNLIAGLSWKSVVAAEVLSVPKFSMGYNLLNAKVYFETAELFAWILAIVGLAYAFEQLIHFLLGNIQWKEYQGSKLMKKDDGLEIESIDSTSCICVQGMDKCFGKKQVFSGYEITIDPGEITAVMGPSGKGKTTLLRIISGLEEADRGKIDLGCERVSYLFQEDRLLPWLNLYDNLAIVLKGKVEFAEADSMIREALERMELSEDIDKLPQQLSGGMNRRVSMARSFVYPAGLLLLDEPFKGLDKALKDRIIEGSWKYYTKDKTVLMVTHSPSDAERLAQRIIEI